MATINIPGVGNVTTTPAASTNPYNADWAKAAVEGIGGKAPNDIDWNAYLSANADASTQWANNSDPGIAALKAAGYGAEDYAKFHYVNDGSRRDLSQDNIYTIAANKKAADDKAAADAAAAAAAAKAARVANVGSARSSASSTANQLLSSYGLDPNKYAGQLGSYFDSITGGLSDTSDPYSAYDPNKLISGIVTNETNAARTKYSNAVNTQLGPNYGDNVINDHLLDSYIDQILNEQKKSATDYVDRGTKRGIFNDAGIAGINSAIAKDYATGKSTLSGLAGGVLDKYQTQANDIASKAAAAASGYNLGGSFDIGQYIRMGNDVAAKASSLGQGDLQAALGGKNFFDFGELSNAAGLGQGATNNVDTGVAAALMDRKKRDSVTRGLGSQGSF